MAAIQVTQEDVIRAYVDRMPLDSRLNGDDVMLAIMLDAIRWRLLQTEAPLTALIGRPLVEKAMERVFGRVESTPAEKVYGVCPFCGCSKEDCNYCENGLCIGVDRHPAK